MTPSPRIHGVYAVTGVLQGEALLDAVAAALRGGVAVVQYRDKGTDPRRRLGEARYLAAACRNHGALFIVNDDLDLARDSGADGVHLGRDDADPATARRRLGAGALVGVSCYDSLQRARDAQAAGAGYLAFGSVFASGTKPGAPRAPLELFRQAREQFQLPLVGIGGIRTDNAARVMEAGADAVAVVEALFGAADVEAAARRLSAAVAGV